MPIVETYKNLEAQLKNAIKAYNKNKNYENYTAAQTLLFRYESAKSEIVFGHLEEKNELIKQFIAERQSRNQSDDGAGNGSTAATTSRLIQNGAVNADGEGPSEQLLNLGDLLDSADKGSKPAPKAIIHETAQEVIDQVFENAIKEVAARSDTSGKQT